MFVFWPKSISKVLVTTALTLLALFATLSSSLFAQELPSLQPMMAENNGPVNWISGPTKVGLGAMGEINVPEGYRLVDAAGGRLVLDRMKNPIPQGLIGILAPASGKWWVVLEYADCGYIETSEHGLIDADGVLKTLHDHLARQNEGRAKLQLPPVGSLTWQVKPNYDASQHSLEWAIHAVAGTQTVINHVVSLLGRRGVITATTVQPDSAAGDIIPVRQLVRNVSFKEGNRYNDHLSGDKMAEIDLTGLITADDNSNGSSDASDDAEATASLRMTRLVWGGAILSGGIASVVVGLLVTRAARKRRVRQASRPVPSIRFQPPPVPLVKNGANNSNPKPVPALNGSNGHAKGQLRRRKMFNHTKFYSAMMMQVSGFPGDLEETVSSAGKDTAHSASPTTPDPVAPKPSSVVNAHTELIANQKAFIEQQQRLIQEQTKFIEEKRKLIEEKNQILEKQSELFEHDIL